MSPLNIPLRPIVDNVLKYDGLVRGLQQYELMMSSEEPYRAVTLEPWQLTPTHGVPQGSSDCPQLGGVFCHVSIRDRTAAAASDLLVSH